MSRLTLTRRYHFSAGHRLESPALSPAANASVYGPCHRPHGHNYLVYVTVAGSLDGRTGMAADLAALDGAVQRVLLERVDHHDLSTTVPELTGVISTGEGLARAFWGWLEEALPAGSLQGITVAETANNVFEYHGEGIGR